MMVMQRLLVLIVLFVSLVAVACVAGKEPPPISTINSYSGFVVASEFVVGPNRFPFTLVSVDGDALEGAAVRVSFSRVEGETEVLYAEATARWLTIPDNTVHVHPDGQDHLHFYFRGIYVVDDVDFPQEGLWIASFDALINGNQVPAVEEAGFRVLTTPGAPGIGERVPATENLTIHQVESFAELSTRQVERDELHNISVAQALHAGEPFVVFFASPLFCISAMCGPVTETLDAARIKLGEKIEFIHIEPWNLGAASEQGQLVPAPVTIEWRLPTEPWTFVVDANGRVLKRFEGLVTVDEIIAAVKPLL